MAARGHWVRRERGGSVVLRFEPVEIETLVAIVADLRVVLEAGAGDDPVSRRLFPRAYLDPTEEEAVRLDALATVTEGLKAAAPGRRGTVEIVLDEDSEPQWLGVLNDARLALGTALDITEETEIRDFAADDPRRDQFLLYSALTSLQGELIDALLGEL